MGSVVAAERRCQNAHHRPALINRHLLIHLGVSGTEADHSSTGIGCKRFPVRGQRILDVADLCRRQPTENIGQVIQPCSHLQRRSCFGSNLIPLFSAPNRMLGEVFGSKPPAGS